MSSCRTREAEASRERDHRPLPRAGPHRLVPAVPRDGGPSAVACSAARASLTASRKEVPDAPHGCTAEQLLDLYLSTAASAKDREVSRLLAEMDGLKQELETTARASACTSATASAKTDANERHDSTEAPPPCPGRDDDDHPADSTDQHTVDPSKIPARTPPAKRAAGHSSDCPCCSKFYQAVYTGSPGTEGRVHMASRHKTRDKMPGTPPGFWSINFTQE